MHSSTILLASVIGTLCLFNAVSAIVIQDPDPCYPNPCQNGGICIPDKYPQDGFTCKCPKGYGGELCQCRQRSLHVFAHYGYNLPDRDLFAGESDPFLQVIAYDCEGRATKKETRVEKGEENPIWAQALDFGVDTWQSFSVQALDRDIKSRDDALTDKHTYRLKGYTGGISYGKVCTDDHCNGFALFAYKSNY